MELNQILQQAVQQEASDVLLKVGAPPAFRLHGDLVPLPGVEALSHQDLQRMADALLDDFRRRRFQTDMQADLAYETAELGRFRVNVFRQRGELSMVIRVIPSRIRYVSASSTCPRSSSVSPPSAAVWCWSPAPPAAARARPWRP